jgi:DNA-binding transcriptional LysR family regulator
MPESDISLEALQILDAIDRRGSYASAAEELNKVTSAVSYSVQKLEASLGVTLFQRIGRKSVLTPAGKFLLENGRQLLASARTLVDQTREVATGWEPRIKIAVDSVYEARPLFCAFNQLLEDSPEIELDVREETLGGGWELIANDSVDLLVGGLGPVPGYHGYRSEAMPALEMVFAVSPSHILTTELQPLSSERISQERLVVVHDSSKTEIPRSNQFLQSHTYCYVQSINQKLCAQLAGVGVGFLPRKVANPYIETGELIELQTEVPSSQEANYLVWKVSNRGKALKKLIPLVLEHYQNFYNSES